jgi:hypothetical protein
VTINKILAAERIEALARTRRELAKLSYGTMSKEEIKALSNPYRELESAIEKCITTESKYLTSISG